MRTERTALVAGVALAGVAAMAIAGPERISFPDDHRASFSQYYSGERLNGEQDAMMFANDVALEGARTGGQLPKGAQIVMEIYKPKTDAAGEVMRDADEMLIPGELAAIGVMEKQAGWGEAYPEELRAGDWDFGMFTPAGEIKSPDSTACLECPLPYVDDDTMHTYAALLDFTASQ